jgi:hypothetical protein
MPILLLLVALAGAVTTAPLAYWFGRTVGYASGVDALTHEATVNDLERQIAEKAQDARIAAEAATLAEERARSLEAAKTEAEEALNEYRAEIEQAAATIAGAPPEGGSPPPLVCGPGRGATDVDARRLQQDAGRGKPRR